MQKKDFLDHVSFEIERLSSTIPIPTNMYYQLGLFVDENNQFHTQTISHWVGFTKDKPQREIREASIINPERLLSLYKTIGEPVFVINTEKDFLFFVYVIGGNAIVEKSIAEKYIKHILQPSINVYSYDKGFVDIKSVPKEKLNRATHPKLRMKIFNRDKRRCKICGASPANNEHVELHIHHIIPYSSGGLTDENNLITLCHTCHNGLDPHIDYSLFTNIGVKLLSSRMNNKPFVERLSRNIYALNEYR